MIASFVGALQWGYAVRDGLEGASAWRGVVPALAGWVALLLPVQTGLALLAATLLLCLVVDHSFARSRPGPAWLLVPLHTALTAGGAACLPACLLDVLWPLPDVLGAWTLASAGLRPHHARDIAGMARSYTRKPACSRGQKAFRETP
ncbi:MAG: DUF3429 domain-containing protein [Pseudomonadales bacterium]|nr:DUF3429 domain-containing protein [Gammaproteobacteria bacterium]MBK6581742.1 DUF3429 domain-containing protein [Gammaproteobacteria bacterium]MBK7170069.1 DUF3429 domain-containing protein [Gammaproteobacteria bacterium]MBK9664437.1 DUF3429 domain-containing protein [Gammaproteobacteria bacterium]MBP6052244.1 DUF3429 domain-containing protein [Pseudomonadales bacterium]